MAKIVINGSMLDDKPTGAGIFANNLINKFVALSNSSHLHEITVYAGSDKFLEKNTRIRKLAALSQASRFKKVAALYRFLWNQANFFFIGLRYDLCINPTTHGSLLLNNQVLTILDLLSLRYDNISFHQRLYFRYFLPRLIRKARKVITISEASKDDIVHFMKCPVDKIEVIYCGFDKSLYKPLPGAAAYIAEQYGLEQFILAVGPTYPHKNFERLIRAFAALPAGTRRQYPLAIIGGRENYIHTLVKLCDELKVKEEVKFLGYVPLQDMPLFYNATRVLVYPSLYEGFGLPPLEAMACGCAVIASNTSSIPEVCGEAVQYIDPLDEADIRQALEKVITNEAWNQELARKGIQQAQLFSWEKAAVVLEKVVAALQ